MKKQITAWYILDKIWEKWETFYDTKPADFTWKELVDSVSPDDIEDYVKEIALEHFLFELKFCFRKPNRNTMEWMQGEHVMLYDAYGCKEHKFIVVRHDDQRMISGQTIFCPLCNIHVMSDDQIEKYGKFVDSEIVSDKVWIEMKKIQKWQKAWNRKENFKYHVHKWMEKGYLQYRINDFIGNLIGAKS